MLQNAYRYVDQRVNGDKMVKDWRNDFTLVLQRFYKGKPEAGLKAGATVMLQINHDDSETVTDKETGLAKDNNVLNTFEVTIPGVEFPLPFAKGDRVSLGGFMQDHSYYINFSFILRFAEIMPYKPTQPVQPAQSTQPTQPTQAKSLTPK